MTSDGLNRTGKPCMRVSRYLALALVSIAWANAGRSQSPTPTPGPTPAAQPGRSLRDACAEPVPGDEAAIDAARRQLYETLCTATLWLDGLFGHRGSAVAAREATGRVEVSALRSPAQGTKVRTALDVDVSLPHLQEKVNAFLGRDSREDYIRARREGFGLRSQFVGLERDEDWLAGIGYSPVRQPGQRIDFRVGASAGRQPRVFAQGLYQRDLKPSESDMWTLREVPFWRSREGFGFTSSADYDHVLNDAALLRWGTVGTVSQGFSGLDWRSAVAVFHRLDPVRAMAYEAFLRGETGTGVRLGEYGARVVYRQSIFRSWLFAEALLGYSWLQLTPEEPRRGSITMGLGMELDFGRGYSRTR